MRPIAAIVTTLAACVALSACSLPTVDKEADAKARALYEQVRTGGDLAANPDLGPELKTPEALAELAKAQHELPEGLPTAIANRSWNISINNGVTSANLVHAYSYPSGVVLAETVLLKDKSKAWKVVGFHLKDGGASGAPAPAPAVTVEKTLET